METIRILIADDHEVIHNGIKDFLRHYKNYVVIGDAYNGREAIEKSLQLKPDIVFMDISMPVLNGIEATREIIEKLPQIKVIAVSQHEENEYVFRFLKSGGFGYLLKNSRKENFIEAIELAIKGKRYVSQDISARMFNHTMKKENQKLQTENLHLTRREIEIVKKIAEEKSNQEIALEMNISLRTVETHRRNIMQKMKVNNVVSLLKKAASLNLIDLSDK